MLCIPEIRWRCSRSKQRPEKSFDDPCRRLPIRANNPLWDYDHPPSTSISHTFFSSSPHRRAVPNHSIVNSLTEHSLITFTRSIVDQHSLYSPGWLQYSYSTYDTTISINTTITLYKTNRFLELFSIFKVHTAQWHT